MTKKILMIVAPGRQSTEGFHWCLHTCKESSRVLRAVFINETNLSQDEVKKIVDEIERQCRTFQVTFETATVSGSYVENLIKEANQSDIDILVMTEKKSSLMKRLFDNSESKGIAEKINCELKVYGCD